MRSFHLTRLLWLSSAIIWAFLFVLGPLLSVQADVENLATETIAINPDGTLEKSDKDIALERELKAAFEAANRSLQIYSDAKERYLSLTKSLLEQGDGQNEVLRELQEMEQLKDSVMQRTKQVNSKIRDINAQQIAQLKDKISLLREREMQRRTRLNEKEHRERMSSRLKIKGIPEDAVLKQQLEELVDIESILAKSDEKLEEWFIGLVKKEVAALQEELELSVIDTTTKIGELEEDENVAALFQKEVEDCSGSTLKDAVQVVQESLVRYSQDRVGMADHLARATVVHHLTSNNYLASIPLSQQIEFSWWFQYLPDDWERFLDKIMPTGWKQWNAKLPDFVYHTLVRFCYSFGLKESLLHAHASHLRSPLFTQGSDEASFHCTTGSYPANRYSSRLLLADGRSIRPGNIETGISGQSESGDARPRSSIAIGKGPKDECPKTAPCLWLPTLFGQEIYRHRRRFERN